jgi:hypothetical protein
LSVLSPIRPVGAELETGREGTDVEPEAPILDQSVTELPEMRDKEAAALIEARNSVVAAWLWRKYAADTRLAGNDILITPCCAIVPPE